MGKLFEGFKMLCSDFNHILKKRGETIQGGILIKEIRYVLQFEKVASYFMDLVAKKAS